MKRWRVKEKWLVTGFTYVTAETKEEAEKALVRDESSDSFDDDNGDWKHEDTDWDTLAEVKP